MNIKQILFAAFSALGISGAFAQGVEYDDMYFNAEDRAKLKAQRAAAVAYNTPKTSKQFDVQREYNVNTNPADSYSARNVNPEYTSRRHTQSAQVEEDEYFVNNYQYNRNQLDNWNNNYSSWYNNSWYTPNYYNPGINTWNSPYYGYNSWNSPWYDPSWSYNGWSSSFSFHHGRGWNYGWGGNYNYWNRPYYGWDPYGMAYSGYGMGYGGGYWNNYRYPGTIVVINRNESNGRGVVYGKRPTRGTSIVSDGNSVRSRAATTEVRDNNSSGRVSTQSRQADYYNRNNRPQRSTSTSSDSRTNTQDNRPSRSWDSNTWDNSNSRSSTPSYSPSRSSSSGSGTRTNTSSGSNGRRGRD
jgi:hypothetical protein